MPKQKAIDKSPSTVTVRVRIDEDLWAEAKIFGLRHRPKISAQDLVQVSLRQLIGKEKGRSAA